MRIRGPTLGSQLDSHANNFGVMRVAAALVVVISHCYPIVGQRHPLWLLYFLHNPWIGNYAVETFFVISGLLVTRSFLSGRQSVARYVAARVLRLYPALIAGVTLTVVLATLCNANPVAETLANPQTWNYFWKNVTAWEFVAPFAGSFPGNKLQGPNGSLWTLPIELRMYIWVGLLGALGILARPRLAVTVLVAAIVVIAIDLLAIPSRLFGSWQVVFAAEFIAGMLAYVLRDRFRLSIPLALALLAAFLVVALFASHDWSRIAFACCLPYWVLVLTCHPAIPIVRLPGDYSYGVYVYAFPLQQTIVWLWPGLPMPAMFVLSIGITLGVAALSWHALEAPMLRLKPAP